MRVLMPQGEPINFDGIERKFLFNINVIDEIQEHYDMNFIDVIKMIFTTDEKLVRESYDHLCYVVSVLANEDTRIFNKTSKEKRQPITEDYIKEILTHATANLLGLVVLKAFNSSVKQNDEKNEDESDPNPTSE